MCGLGMSAGFSKATGKYRRQDMLSGFGKAAGNCFDCACLWLQQYSRRMPCVCTCVGFRLGLGECHPLSLHSPAPARAWGGMSEQPVFTDSSYGVGELCDCWHLPAQRVVGEQLQPPVFSSLSKCHDQWRAPACPSKVAGGCASRLWRGQQEPLPTLLSPGSISAVSHCSSPCPQITK